MWIFNDFDAIRDPYSSIKINAPNATLPLEYPGHQGEPLNLSSIHRYI